jgi:hypothetical protein
MIRLALQSQLGVAAENPHYDAATTTADTMLDVREQEEDRSSGGIHL